jgi:signal transduction histidine kinase
MSVQTENSEALDLLLAHRQQAEYFSALSHELRTPLNGLLGYVSLLLDGQYGPLSEPQSKAVGEIRGSAKHLLGIIESLLEFSRVSQGRQVAHPVVFQPRLMLERLADRLSPLAEAKKLAVSIDVDDLAVELDEYVIEQLMTNLLGNAIKFTPKGGRIRIAAKRNGDGAMEWGVADSGPGIPLASRTRIFEPFVQLASQSVRAHGGTGIGLSLCRTYASMLRGVIGVEDNVPQGTYVFALTPETLRIASGLVGNDEFQAAVALANRFSKRIQDQFAVLEVANLPADINPVEALRRFLRPADLMTLEGGKLRLAMYGVEPISARLVGERMKNAFLYENRVSIGVKLLRLEEIL